MTAMGAVETSICKQPAIGLWQKRLGNFDLYDIIHENLHNLTKVIYSISNKMFWNTLIHIVINTTIAEQILI